MPLDKAYLVKHGSQWRVQVAIPRHLQAFMGKARLLIPLHTDSLALANREKHKHVHALKQEIAKAELEAKRKGSAAGPMVSEALTWRQAMADARAQDGVAPDPEDDGSEWSELEAQRVVTQADGVSEALEARHDELLRTVGPAKSDAFVSIATAKGTPISALVDDWLVERPMKPRQKIDYRRAVRKLEAWAVGAGKLTAPGGASGMAEAVTKREAGAYKTSMVRAGVNWRTANKDISALSMFWKWLESRGVARENVWTRMLLPKLKPAEGNAKRPYTDAEVTRLLSGKAPSVALKDAMTIAALSGMRIEEIVRMRVGDIKGDLIDLKGTKTAAARRIVPVHPDLKAIIGRRCAGKAADAFLFDELPTPPPESSRERSSPLVKAFTRYRRARGVDERGEGARQSNVDFHSFRRWFAQSARDALTSGRASGFSEWTLAEVMGHSKEDMPLGMTMGVYAGKDTLEAKRACVRAVSLPTLTLGVYTTAPVSVI